LAWDHIRMFFSKYSVKSPVFTYTLLIVFALLIDLSAAQVRVVTITDDFAAIAQSIGGKFVQVDRLVEGSKNLHDIHPKPSMVMKVKRADLLIRLGMSQDSWIDGLIQVARNNRVFPGENGYLDPSLFIDRLEQPTVRIDAGMGDVHKEGNPHYWLNPKIGIIIADRIKTQLSLIDPDNMSYYEANFIQFESNMLKKINVWKRQIHALSGHSFITYHKVWSYFFDFFNLNLIAHVEPLPGVPPTTAHVKSLINQIELETTPIIFITANFYPNRVPNQIASATGSESVVISPHIISDETQYTDLFDRIIGTLTQASKPKY
jgi:zinc/manganese transport system substrate-binding protein